MPPDEARETLSRSNLRAVTTHTVVDIDTLMGQIDKGRETRLV
ncbi:hypothetical protein ACTMU2_10005 [Cupriavidus basilensis]